MVAAEHANCIVYSVIKYKFTFLVYPVPSMGDMLSHVALEHVVDVSPTANAPHHQLTTITTTAPHLHPTSLSSLSLSLLFLPQLHPFCVSWSLVSYCISLLCWIPAFPHLCPILSSAGQQTTQSLLPLYTLAHRLPQSRVCCLCLDLYFIPSLCLLVFLPIDICYLSSLARPRKNFPSSLRPFPRYTQRTR